MTWFSPCHFFSYELVFFWESGIVGFMKKVPFKIPKAFLNQLKEFSDGFYLVTINETGAFETNSYFPTQTALMGLLNFMEIESSVLQEDLRTKALNKLAEEENGEDDEEADA